MTLEEMTIGPSIIRLKYFLLTLIYATYLILVLGVFEHCPFSFPVVLVITRYDFLGSTNLFVPIFPHSSSL